MDSHLESELDRLVRNATARREILLVSGLLRARVRRALNVVSGILALSSAGAIAAVLAKVAGQESTQIAAAISAGASGVTSLLVANYFEESDALNRLTGASKYLVLRDNVYRLLIRPGLTDEQRLTLLAEMQAEYARLDEGYNRYFPSKHSRTAPGLPRRISDQQIHEAVEIEMGHFRQELREAEARRPAR